MGIKRVRDGEARVATSRAGEKRKAYRSRYEGNMSLPPEVLRDAKKRNVRLHWMARSVMGDQSTPGVQLGNRMMRGWSPVPKDVYPDLNGPQLPGAPETSIIERGGMILMQKDLDEWKADREELRRENQHTMSMIHFADGVEGQHMPKFNESGDVQIERRVTAKRGAEFQGDDE